MDLKILYDAVVNGEVEGVVEGVPAALAESIPAEKILNKALIPAMAEVGRLFEAQEYYVPEMLISAKAMQSGVNILRPLLVAAGLKPIGKVVLGTVKGDLHDIGKNLVAMMLEGAGFEIVDLGVDVSPETFVKAARDGAQIIGMSALLTTTMTNMSVVIEALKTAGLRDQVKVLIGGAPVTQEYANKIGADMFASDASSAVRSARLLVA